MAALSVLDAPTGGKARRTHRALVEATRAVLAGTGGFTAEQVAERAGMAPATFYAYFPTKDDALAAALDLVLGDLIDGTLEVLTVESLLEEGLRAVAERMVAVPIRVFTDSALVFRLAVARIPESKVMRHVYREHQRRAFDELRRFLRLGAAAGKLRVPDPDTTTMALLVFLQGLNNPALLGRSSEDPLVAAMVDMAVQLLDPAGG